MELTVELFAQSLRLVTSQGEALGSRFYRRLFQKFPDVTPLFTHCSIKAQQLPLASRVFVLQHLQRLGILTTALEESSGRYMADDAQPACHDVAEAHLWAVCEERPDTAWTPPKNHALVDLVRATTTILLEGHPRGGFESSVKTRKSEQSTLRQAQGPELRRGVHHEGGPHGRSNA